MTWLPWDVDKTHNNNKGIKVRTKHPKVKWRCISKTRCKSREDTNILGFLHHIMEHFSHHLAEIVHAHIIAKPNVVATNFQ
jgi:hypothetical protein